MKSIRVSLIVYFLSLLLLGLGGVSVLAYRTTADNLHNKEHNGRLFLDADYEDSRTSTCAKNSIARSIATRLLIDHLSRPPYPWERVSTAWHRNMPMLGFRQCP